MGHAAGDAFDEAEAGADLASVVSIVATNPDTNPSDV